MKKPLQRTQLILFAFLITGLAGYGAIAGTPPFVESPYDITSLPYQGAGGDPALLDILQQQEIDLASINQIPLNEIQTSLPQTDAILYRGYIRHNLLRRGLRGFQVCAYASPSTNGFLKTQDGYEIVCAISDSNGLFTFVGLPKDAETTLVIKRDGFLNLAFTTRLTHLPTYQQDYVGSVPVYFVRSLYDRDPCYPFCAGGNCNDYGEMIFTIINETRTQDNPNHGYISPGMYEGNGTPNATIQIFTDSQQDGSFASPYPTIAANNPSLSQPDNVPDGLVYSGTMLEDIEHTSNGQFTSLLNFFANTGFESVLLKQEYPQLWRTETSTFGLALMKSMPAGIYEAEVTHPNLTCLPTKDAWTGSTPTRLRFEIIPGTLGDVRFYCERKP
ncbi:MAG: hypothetical protein RL275_1871 [Chloroflexota bacterium]|jgi:hypothetical protein